MRTISIVFSVIAVLVVTVTAARKGGESQKSAGPSDGKNCTMPEPRNGNRSSEGGKKDQKSMRQVMNAAVRKTPTPKRKGGTAKTGIERNQKRGHQNSASPAGNGNPAGKKVSASSGENSGNSQGGNRNNYKKDKAEQTEGNGSNDKNKAEPTGINGSNDKAEQTGNNGSNDKKTEQSKKDNRGDGNHESPDGAKTDPKTVVKPEQTAAKPQTEAGGAEGKWEDKKGPEVPPSIGSGQFGQFGQSGQSGQSPWCSDREMIVQALPAQVPKPTAKQVLDITCGENQGRMSENPRDCTEPPINDEVKCAIILGMESQGCPEAVTSMALAALETCRDPKTGIIREGKPVTKDYCLRNAIKFVTGAMPSPPPFGG